MEFLPAPISSEDAHSILPSIVEPNIIRTNHSPNLSLVANKSLHSLSLLFALTMTTRKLMYRSAGEEHTSPIRMRAHQHRIGIRDLNCGVAGLALLVARASTQRICFTLRHIR